MRRANRKMLLFAAGFILGMIVINIEKGTLLFDTGLLDEDTLCRMKYMTVDSSALFCYVLRKRMSVMLLLAVAATTYLGLAVCTVAVLWFGFSAGGFLAVLLLRYGIKGLLLAAVGIFPQYVLYVPAFVLLLKWGEQLYRGIYLRGMGAETGEKGFVWKKLGQLAVVLGLTAAGCALEGYINSGLLLGFLKIF